MSKKNSVPQVVLPESERHLSTLIEAFQAGDVDEINSALKNLGARSESDLYQKVGGLTRSLHDALMQLQQNLKTNATTMDSTTIPDAASKLETIIEMTQKSAHSTLESTERQEEIFDSSREALDEGLALLEDMNGVDQKLKEKLTGLLRQEKTRVEEASQFTSQIVQSQEYQDLTGQVLRKVIKLVSDMEGSLLELVQLFGESAGRTTQETDAEGDGRLAQDEVDDILSDLGF